MKSLYEILEEKDRLRILAKEIDKDGEVTEEFKNQHLENIQGFLKTTEIPNSWDILLNYIEINPFLNKVFANFGISGERSSCTLLFIVESYIYDDICSIYIKDLTVYHKKLIFRSEKYLDNIEFNNFLKEYIEIINEQQKKEE